MLTFIHLSDIHFSPEDNGSQFDLNQRIRQELLLNLSAIPPGSSQYDGVLITGDIAAHGKKDEYETAQAFLAEIYKVTSLSMKETYVVPGNHDVDRAYVQPNFPLWESHAAIRAKADPIHWRDTIQTQLTKDPLQVLLAPFHTYNDFAQRCGCQTTATKLAWNLVFPKPLELGFNLRLHGLNSALISDAGDAPSKLLISEFQTTGLTITPGEVNLTLCHHPPDWLMDKSDIRLALRRFVPIALFGHEHSARIQLDDKQAQLFAGATHPSRIEPGWLPTYHILQIAVEGTAANPTLTVYIHSREFASLHFRPWRNEDDKDVSEWRMSLLPVSNRSGQPAEPFHNIMDSTATMQIQEKASLSKPSDDPLRGLLVYFFELQTPQRYEVAYKAGLLRDGDDALDPQVMWEAVFRRAKDENKLAAFWKEIAAHTPAIRSLPNPFTGDHA